MKLPLLTVPILLLLAACTPSGDKQAASSEPTSAATTTGAPAATPDAASQDAEPAIDTAAAEQAVNDAIENNLGNHTRYQATIRDLQAAVAAGDAAKVAALTHYPLSVEIGGKQALLNNEQEFVARYAEIMTPDISKAIVDTSYANLFVSYKGVMFGKGEAWIIGFCTDDACKDVTVKLIALQADPIDRPDKVQLDRCMHAPDQAPSHGMQQPASLSRSASNTLKGSAGNLVEWYDVYVYSVFAAYFEAKFFRPEDKNATLAVWAIFAVTFLMRPIGAWWFGRYADRHGRRASLSVSITLMAACSFAIAITPSVDTIGAGAAIILLLARLVQGFATGGEYGTSATYMSEAAIRGHRGFLSSFHYVTLVGGHVLAQALLLAMLLTVDAGAIADWGWRLAFGIGGLGAVVVLWLRRSMDESLSSEAIARAREGGAGAAGSLRELFVNQWRPLLLCFLITAGGTVAFYTYSISGPKIIQGMFAGGDALTGTRINLAALTLLMLLQPLGGWLSDRIGRKSLLVFFGVGGVLYTWVLLVVLPRQTDALAAFGILALGFVILTGYTSINAVVKAELFPTHIRALGVGLGYALANSAFGGTAPLLYQASLRSGHMDEFVVYVTAVIAVSLFVYVFFLTNKGETWLDRDA